MGGGALRRAGERRIGVEEVQVVSLPAYHRYLYGPDSVRPRMQRPSPAWPAVAQLIGGD